MDDESRVEKRKAYNKEWISSQRKKTLSVKERKRMELEKCFESSSDENDENLLLAKIESRKRAHDDSEVSTSQQYTEHEESANSDGGINKEYIDSMSELSENSDGDVNFDLTSTEDEDEDYFDGEQLKESLTNLISKEMLSMVC